VVKRVISISKINPHQSRGRAQPPILQTKPTSWILRVLLLREGRRGKREDREREGKGKSERGKGGKGRIREER